MVQKSYQSQRIKYLKLSSSYQSQQKKKFKIKVSPSYVSQKGKRYLLLPSAYQSKRPIRVIKIGKVYYPAKKSILSQIIPASAYPKKPKISIAYPKKFETQLKQKDIDLLRQQELGLIKQKEKLEKELQKIKEEQQKILDTYTKCAFNYTSYYKGNNHDGYVRIENVSYILDDDTTESELYEIIADFNKFIEKEFYMLKCPQRFQYAKIHYLVQQSNIEDDYRQSSNTTHNSETIEYTEKEFERILFNIILPLLDRYIKINIYKFEFVNYELKSVLYGE